MNFKNIIDQSNYYANNNISADKDYKNINEKMGHYIIFNNLELFSTNLDDLNKEELASLYAYIKSSKNNICIFKLISAIISKHEIVNAQSAISFVNEFNIDSNHIKNIMIISDVVKKVILYYMKDSNNEKIEFSTELYNFFDDLALIQSIIPVNSEYYIKYLLNASKEIKTQYLSLINEDIYEKINAIAALNNNEKIKGYFTIESNSFLFNFNNLIQQQLFIDFKIPVTIDMETPSLKLELELMKDSTNANIPSELVIRNNIVFAEIETKEENLIFDLKDKLVYEINSLLTKALSNKLINNSIKVVNHPYTRLAIAGIVAASSLMHTDSAMAGEAIKSSQHLSESDISHIMSHSPYILKMKNLMFGGFGQTANPASVDSLHHTKMWQSVDAQFHQLGIDLNDIQSNHFNKMSMTNKFSWVSADSGYEFHGGGYIAKFKLENHHYVMDLVDRGQSEIIDQKTFINWSNKILNKLNEAHRDLHKTAQNHD